MVQKLALYTALSLIKGRFFKGILGMVFSLGALSFFLGATLLLEGRTASEHFFSFTLTPCLLFSFGQSVLATLFRKRDTKEEDFFLSRGLHPLRYGAGVFLGYGAILFCVCAFAVLFFLTVLNASGARGLHWGFSLFLQGVGVIWLAILLGFSSKSLSQGVLCLGLVLTLSVLKKSLLATLTSTWSPSFSTHQPIVTALQKLSLLLPSLTLDVDVFSWQDTLHFASILSVFTVLTFRTSLRRSGLLGASALVIFLAFYPVSLARQAATTIPYNAPTLTQRHFLQTLSAPFFGYASLFYLHHAGDVDGKRLPLRAYDYTRVTAWLRTAHALAPSSELPPFLGTFYFGMTPDPHQRTELASYLREYAREKPENNFWMSFAHQLQKKISSYK
jgi:hypothetical protein